MAILPDNAPSLVATEQMTKAFHEDGDQSIAVVVLSDDKGLSPADEDVYRKLVDILHKDTHDIVMVQDFLGAEPLRQLMTSKDHKAWLLPIALPGIGSRQSKQAFTRVDNLIKHTVAGTGLTAYVTGPASTVADMNLTGQRDRTRIEVAIVVLLFFILLIIYRNPITMVLPLITIGMSLVVAQRVVAIIGSAGLGVATQTVIFMTGMMVGAGTDYRSF